MRLFYVSMFLCGERKDCTKIKLRQVKTDRKMLNRNKNVQECDATND
jgi:hypothetical protein